jgi:hypothetical protein
MRPSLAMKEFTMPEGAGVTTELAREHAEIEQLVQRIATLKPGPGRTALVRQVTTRYLAHIRAEERYLMPAVRRFLPNGGEVAVEQERLAQAVGAEIEGIERTEDSDEYEALVGQFILDAQQHIEQQDTVLLPSLLDACPLEEVNHLGRQMRYAMSSGG